MELGVELPFVTLAALRYGVSISPFVKFIHNVLMKEGNETLVLPGLEKKPVCIQLSLGAYRVPAALVQINHEFKYAGCVDVDPPIMFRVIVYCPVEGIVMVPAPSTEEILALGKVGIKDQLDDATNSF
jgi:hypothetical protein